MSGPEQSWGPREKLLLVELISEAMGLEWGKVSKQMQELVDNCTDLNASEEVHKLARPKPPGLNDRGQVCRGVFTSICASCDKEACATKFDGTLAQCFEACERLRSVWGLRCRS